MLIGRIVISSVSALFKRLFHTWGQKTETAVEPVVDKAIDDSAPLKPESEE
jgi:hypothetical protein